MLLMIDNYDSFTFNKDNGSKPLEFGNMRKIVFPAPH